MLISHSAEETEALGYEFAEVLTGDETICITGGIGHGKSTFTRGIIKKLLPEAEYVPPIGRCICSYGGKILHIDGSNFLRCGLPEEFLQFDGIRIIEHGDLWHGALVFEHEIKISKTTHREVEIWQTDSSRMSPVLRKTK